MQDLYQGLMVLMLQVASGSLGDRVLKLTIMFSSTVYFDGDDHRCESCNKGLRETPRNVRCMMGDEMFVVLVWDKSVKVYSFDKHVRLRAPIDRRQHASSSETKLSADEA